MKKKVRKVNLNKLCFRTVYQLMCQWKHPYIIWPARPGWIIRSIRSIAQGSTSHNTLLATDRSSGLLKETSQTTGEDSKHLRCKQMQGTWNKRWDSEWYLVLARASHQFNARTNGGKIISRDYLLFEPNREPWVIFKTFNVPRKIFSVQEPYVIVSKTK